MAKEDVIKMPPVSVLQKLLQKNKTAKSKMDELKGDLGEAMSDAVDTHNVHAGAFKLIAKLQRMDGVKLMSFLTHFDHYRDKLGIDKLTAPDLIEEPPEAEPEPPVEEPPLKDDDPTGTGQKAPMFTH